MQATKKQELKARKNLNRMFLIAKVLFCIFPFAAVGYLYMSAQQYGLSYEEMMHSNPVLAVTFLSAMCQPFAAWLLTIVQRRVDSMDYSNAFVCLLLIFIAECMLKNWLGIAATAVLFWMVNKDSPYDVAQEFKKYANWKKIMLDASGCLVLILLAGICLFASLRLG